MKILTISDTHTKHKKIPKEWLLPADVIIHGGDVSSQGFIHEAESFLKWFDSLDYEHKIFIAGNHDFCFEKTNNNHDKIMSLLKTYPKITYLNDSGCEIEGVKFYGSPWQPEFYDWAFNLTRGPIIQEKWDLIPLDTDVLITHGPPYGIGDLVPYRGGEFVGCRDLLDTISTKLKIKLHVCGHIHYSYGIVHKNGIDFINASTLNESYDVANKPILIEI